MELLILLGAFGIGAWLVESPTALRCRAWWRRRHAAVSLFAEVTTVRDVACNGEWRCCELWSRRPDVWCQRCLTESEG